MQPWASSWPAAADDPSDSAAGGAPAEPPAELAAEDGVELLQPASSAPAVSTAISSLPARARVEDAGTGRGDGCTDGSSAGRAVAGSEPAARTHGVGPIARDRPSRSRTTRTGGPRSDGRSLDSRAGAGQVGERPCRRSYWPSLPGRRRRPVLYLAEAG